MCAVAIRQHGVLCLVSVLRVRRVRAGPPGAERRAPGGSALPALSGREGIKQLTHALSFGGADQLTEPTDLAQLRPLQWARMYALSFKDS